MTETERGGESGTAIDTEAESQLVRLLWTLTDKHEAGNLRGRELASP